MEFPDDKAYSEKSDISRSSLSDEADNGKLQKPQGYQQGYGRLGYR